MTAERESPANRNISSDNRLLKGKNTCFFSFIDGQNITFFFLFSCMQQQTKHTHAFPEKNERRNWNGSIGKTLTM